MREPGAVTTIGRRPLLRVAVAAVAAATVTTTVVVAQNTGTSPRTQPVIAATVLRGAASEERKLEKPIAPRDDQFIYSKEITKETPVGGGRSKTYVDENWDSVDGSKKSYGGELGHAQWFPPFKPGQSVWPPNRWSELKQLPTDPAKLPFALRNLLGNPEPDRPVRAREWPLIQIGLSYLLRKAVLPKGLRPAAFEALATVPGIKLLPGLTDGAGRPGVGIQYVDPNMPRGGVEQVLVFDAKTYQYLGLRGGRKEGGTTYQQWSYHAVSGVVDRVMQRP
jgi:hypothetical protein